MSASEAIEKTVSSKEYEDVLEKLKELSSRSKYSLDFDYQGYATLIQKIINVTKNKDERNALYKSIFSIINYKTSYQPVPKEYYSNDNYSQAEGMIKKQEMLRLEVDQKMKAAEYAKQRAFELHQNAEEAKFKLETTSKEIETFIKQHIDNNPELTPQEKKKIKKANQESVILKKDALQKIKTKMEESLLQVLRQGSYLHEENQDRVRQACGVAFTQDLYYKLRDYEREMEAIKKRNVPNNAQFLYNSYFSRDLLKNSIMFL